MQRILGRKSVMGKRKTTRLLNSIAAGYLDEEKYPIRSARAAPAASPFISAGPAFFDGRSADFDGGAASAPAASDEGITADEEDDDAAAYETEKELADMLRRSGAETSTLHKFQCIQRRIRHELKRVQDLSFLSSLERYLTSFKFDELDPGHEFDGGDAFRICSAAELGVDTGSVPAPMRPLFLELFSPYHRCGLWPFFSFSLSHRRTCLIFFGAR
jgi:hypothetical protein